MEHIFPRLLLSGALSPFDKRVNDLRQKFWVLLILSGGPIRGPHVQTSGAQALDKIKEVTVILDSEQVRPDLKFARSEIIIDFADVGFEDHPTVVLVVGNISISAPRRRVYPCDHGFKPL